MRRFVEFACKGSGTALIAALLLVAGLTAGARQIEQPLFDKGESVILISRPDQNQGYFDRSVILVRRHGKQGSLGVILNRPSQIALSEVFPENDFLKDGEQRLYEGGPVSPRVLVFLYRTDEKDPRDSLHIVDDIYLSFHKERLAGILENPEQLSWLKVFHGHAGWYEGQLEQELERGSWYLYELDSELIYDPEIGSLWDRLIRTFRGIWV